MGNSINMEKYLRTAYEGDILGFLDATKIRRKQMEQDIKIVLSRSIIQSRGMPYFPGIPLSV